MKTLFARTVVFVLFAAGAALANQPALYVEYVHTNSSQEASLLVLPDGSGPPLSAAQAFGGAVVDATVEIRVVDPLGLPVPNFPREDLWINAEDGGLSHCRFNSVVVSADGNTDADGRTTFSGTAPAGGWSSAPVYVYLSGSPVWMFGTENTLHPALSLRLNSPDINADGRVDLSDVPLFAGDFHGDYAYRSDFVWDGAINLSDVVKMAQSLGAACP